MTDVLQITVADDLSSLRFAQGDEDLGQIITPQLLWECSCNPASGGRSPAQGPCRLHGLPRAAAISARFGYNNIIWHRGIPTLWDSSAGWPPSVDSWFMVKTLLDHDWPGPQVQGLWDIGAGTGFLGLQLANASDHLRWLHAVEISPSAAQLCRYNLDQTCPGSLECAVLHQDGATLDPSLLRSSDAIVSAPPYIPQIPQSGGCAVAEQGPAVGLSLLRAVIRLTREARVPLALLYSSVAEREVTCWIAEGALEEHILATRVVPFRVALTVRHIHWLVERGGLVERDESVFAYWHQLRVAVLQPS
jgi:hypothetical protein